MSILGKWRIVKLPGYEDDYADMVAGGARSNAVAFAWSGNDEMDEASGEGWAELQPDGSLQGEIDFQGGDEIPFIARPWPTSSTPC